jgi:hypothetical protein
MLKCSKHGFAVTMATIETQPGEVAVIGKLVANEGRYLISVSSEYAEDLRKITARRVLVKVLPLV